MMLANEIKMLEVFYVPLVEAFLRADLTAEEFRKIYFEKKYENRNLSSISEIAEVLDSIFVDLDAYDPEPDRPWEINEDELRRCCTENLAKLKAFVQEYEAQS